ncbi:MAG: PSD1 and planctomycete cytochrome C domain-containing protein [Steroidobacteraceae bacterium]
MAHWRSTVWIGAALAATGVFAAVHLAQRRPVAAVDFSRDIRPIFNQYCVSCHGGVRQKSEVSFIYREEALGKGSSGRATIVPGRPEASELIARITSTDPEVRMPYHAPPLQPQQIALLRQWIKDGAQWSDHWAFVAPKDQPLPAVKDSAWPRQPVDRFILARLEREGLQPSGEAERAGQLRRVSLDLTGLPPTEPELSAFLADKSPDAYERQVDRLLASPHYGERWAALWLDLARYADSRGYEADHDRPVWPYRDWVVDAFNRNISYEQFVTTQLAGDLLPNATLDDRVATTFQRLTPLNDEGGTDDEEFRLVAVMDRVATTWSVLNGLTMNCVQCHSHPYDPIRHAEYYKFLGFYNTSRDSDLVDDYPTIPLPKDNARRSEAAALEARRMELWRSVLARSRSLEAAAEWALLPLSGGNVSDVDALERNLHSFEAAQLLREVPDPDWHPTPKELTKFYKDSIAGLKSDLVRARAQPLSLPLASDGGGGLSASGTIPLRSVLQVDAEATPGTITALRIESPVAKPDVAIHTPEDGFLVERIGVWIVSGDGSARRVPIRCFLPDAEDNLQAATKPPYAISEPYDAQLDASGFSANPKLFRSRWVVAVPAQPLAVPAGAHVRVDFQHTTGIDMRPAPLRRVRLYASADPRWIDMATQHSLAAELGELVTIGQRLKKMPSVLQPVMAEQASFEQRHTLEFERGNFMNKIGPALQPDVPAIFPALPAAAPRNRLTMARWFFSSGQPLTARVAVNRYWEQLFGTGLVETLEDFGSAGQVPSHPELLDWLALHFQRDLHWDMKALLRELVTSATYRQSARATATLMAKDPHNRLLAHGPQQRLSAEMVRDQALVASGLFNPALGGPPVKPPQPAGVWMSVYDDRVWDDAKGPDRYRRAIYTYLRRTALYPSFVTFDAADHVVSLPRRIVTNTPLQALVTLNDPVYQEAGRALAKRMLARKETQAARFNFAARCVLSRDLSESEAATLQSFYEQARREPDLPAPAELSAYTAVAGVLFNLDAALTR